VAALTVALAIGFSTLEIYQLGAKFVGAVANYARLAQEAAAAQQHKPAPPDMKNEPGVVPVSIIPKKDEKKN
jgi:hypothetical protein